MDNILGDRVKAIRETKGLKQQEMADILKISRSQITSYETGRRDLNDRTINDICREFNVREEWLRTGEGDMFILTNDDSLLADALADIIDSGDEKLCKIVTNLNNLDEKYVNIICDLITNLAEDKKEN
jgi:transcriptional regulator with XRE-family HTH domain